MPSPLPVTPGSNLELCLRAFFSFESEYAAGTESIFGKLAVGEAQIVGVIQADDETQAVLDMSDEIAAWRGPRSTEDRVLLGGEPARLLEERDDRDLELPSGFRPSIDLIATGRASTSTYSDWSREVAVFCRSTSFTGRSLAHSVERLDQLRAAADAGDLSAAQDLAQLELRQLAALNVTTVTVDLNGATVDVPILNATGRFLHGASLYFDHVLDRRDAFAKGHMRDEWSMVECRLVNNFFECMLPTLESATRNPNRFFADLRALSRRCPELFGPTTNPESVSMHTRRQLAAFLEVPELFEDALQREVLGAGRHPQASRFTMNDVERVQSHIVTALRRPEVERRF